MLLGAIPAAIHSQNKMKFQRLRTAKIHSTLGRIINAIEQVDDSNEADLTDLKELARNIKEVLSGPTTSTGINESNEVKP